LVAGTGWGVYADGKVRREPRGRDQNFLSAETVTSIEDAYPLRRRQEVAAWDEWSLLNMGLARAIGPEFRLVVGGGLAKKGVILEYFDEALSDEEKITPSGTYYVRDERHGKWEANGTIAGIVQIGSNLAVSVGFETAPASMSVGAFMLFW
jgi:hypothetical protein